MIRVAVANVHPARRIAVAKATRAVRTVLAGEGIRSAAVTIVAIDSRRCRRLNRRYLSHDRVTDVISFPIEAAPLMEGEVYVNLDAARRQAREFGVTPENEVLRLIVHGALHLAGYDDRNRRDASRMHRRQEAYVSQLQGPRARGTAGK